MRALLTSRKSVKDAIINIELSLRGLLRNFGLRVGPISKGRYDVRVRELIAGNAMPEAAVEPNLWDVRIQDCRHSFASRALALGESLRLRGAPSGRCAVPTERDSADARGRSRMAGRAFRAPIGR